MALLKKFFKPKWQHDNPEVRRQALSDLQDESTLLIFIERESQAELRLQAVKKITSTALLEQLSQHQHADVRQHARQQWLQYLLPAQGIDSVSNDEQLVQIAALTDDQALRIAAIARISDQQQRLQLALNHPAAKVRLAAAEGVSDADKLQQLQQHAQGKDKAVYRLCKERLAAAREAQEQQQALQRQLQTLQQQLNYLNRLGYQPDFYARLQVLSKDWQALQPHASTTDLQQINAAFEQAQQLLDAHQQQEQQRQQELQQQQQAAQQQQQLLQQLAELQQQCPVSDEPQAMAAQLKLLQQQWHDSFVQHKPDTASIRQFENTQQHILTILTTLEQYEQLHSDIAHWLNTTAAKRSDALKQQLQQGQRWLQQLSWPLDDKPDWWQAIEQQTQQLQQQLQQNQQQQQQRWREIEQLLSQFRQQLEQGMSKEANRLQSKLQQLCKQGCQPEHQRQLKALTQQLHDMRDWQGFATAPKKEALVADMEALVDSELPAELLADKIHDLQQQWKALTGGQSDQALWERFQTAGDQAFEPCRAFFAERAQQREQFVAARHALIAELKHYAEQMDWSQADWKAVQKTLDVARATFQQYSPVDRAAHKSTQQQFRQACDAIQQPLQQHYQENLTSKQALVDQAEQLLSQDDLAAAIEQAKQLQQQWKRIGATPRRDDQKLWKRFRLHCDALFARLSEQRQSRQQDIEQAVQAAEALAQAAESADSTDSLRSLQQQFNAIDLPRSAHQRLLSAFKQAEQRLQQVQQQQQLAERQARWHGLSDKLHALHGGDQQRWQDAQLPTECDSKLFEQAWAATLECQYEAAELCLRMELLANVDSPAHDQSRRMEIQIQRLADGLGKGLDRDAERLQLVHQWLAASPDAKQLQRFINALMASL